ncbi:MAG TPA: hypothetical protein VIM41_08585 [Gammaproteobacteria bacterium]
MMRIPGRQNSSKYNADMIVDERASPIRLLICLLATAGLLWSVVAVAEKKIVEKKYTAVARKSIEIPGDGMPGKLEFRFDGASVWLKENGEFGLEAEIKHSGLLCGDYEVGIRFGIGIPACANVSWITEPYYVSKKKQCNNAWMVHGGTGEISIVPEDFAQLSCAQLIIKCTGKCE